MSTVTAEPTARAFLRSLNILLKFARLYGLEHTRCSAQLDVTWSELQNALGIAGTGGLLLAVSGTKLLLDGVPLDATQAERSFAGLLSTVGVASVCFSRNLSREQFANFIRVFSSGGLTANLGDQLRTALAEGTLSGIRINEVRFVEEDSATADTQLAAQIAARTLGGDAEKLQTLLRDPQKLIQLIAAAEGTERGPGQGSGAGPGRGQGAGPGTGFAAGASEGDSGSGTGSTGSAAGATSRGGPGSGAGPGPTGASAAATAPPISELPEDDLMSIFRLLVQLGEASTTQSKELGPVQIQETVGKLPDAARLTLRQALASVANSATQRTDEPMLVRLAEDLAIRFALDRYQRGEVRVDAVRQILDRMGREIDALRKILRSREAKLADAGVTMESHADVLDRQFWASVPESGKRSVLLTPEAWCIPPRNVQQYVEELFARGDEDTAVKILRQYAACIHEKQTEARCKAASGLVQMAELYSRAGAATLDAVIRELGAQIKIERDTEMQTLLSAAFVRFTHEAAAMRFYSSLERAIDALAEVEKLRPSAVQGIRSRLGLETRCSEFIEEALEAPSAPSELVSVLKRLPEPASEQLAARLPRCVLVPERERVVALAQELGQPCVEHLRGMLRCQPGSKAAATVGLLSRLDPAPLEETLAALLPLWNRAFHESVLRQLSIAGSPTRGRLLMELLGRFDPLLQPLVVDEVGLSGDAEAADGLLRLAEDETASRAAEYLRVKAIEALGRLGEREAIPRLRIFVETKRAWRWAYPSEVRMTAARALEVLDLTWTRSYLPESGLDLAALAMGAQEFRLHEARVRMRRYPRVRIAKMTAAQICSTRGKFTLELKALGLGGGVLYGEHQFGPGAEAILKIPQVFWSVTAQVIFRQTRSLHTVFEIVGIDLEERAKLRRLLVALSSESIPSRTSTELRME